MKISSLFQTEKPIFSFEFFPPKDDAAAEELFRTVTQLQKLSPDFVTVTYGAGGSTRTKTLDLVVRIKKDLRLEAMAHLTCVGHSKTEIRSILQELHQRGIENILALRGDPPKGETTFQAHPDGFRYAYQLAEEVARTGHFCFGVAGYPEKHVEAPSYEADLENLKRKVDTGASFVTTQLFFDNAYYFRFVERVRALGIHVPILPGLMPITNLTQVQRFSALCGATIPLKLVDELTHAGNDPEAVIAIGVRHALEQCRELLAKGAPGIHFYTLNKSRATVEILKCLR